MTKMYEVWFHPQRRPAGRPTRLHLGTVKSVAMGFVGRALLPGFRRRGRVVVEENGREIKAVRIGAR